MQTAVKTRKTCPFKGGDYNFCDGEACMFYDEQYGCLISYFLKLKIRRIERDNFMEDWRADHK